MEIEFGKHNNKSMKIVHDHNNIKFVIVKESLWSSSDSLSPDKSYQTHEVAENNHPKP